MSGSTDPRTVALVLAAGAGTRLGRSPKAFVDLGGESLFVHSLRTIVACSEIEGLVLVVPQGHQEAAADTLRSLRPAPSLLGVRVGGGTRRESVELGLRALPEGTNVVVCHDAARPFATPDLFHRVIEGLLAADGAVPVVSSPDTLKRVRDGLVVETLPRDELRLAQTPQAFSAAVLRSVHRHPGTSRHEATDDAMMVEAAGFKVVAVRGEPGNFKITTEDDLLRARWFLGERVRSKA